MFPTFIHIAFICAAALLPVLALVVIGQWYKTSRLVAVIFAASLVCGSAAFFMAHCGAARKLTRLRWDMTREEVVAVAGEPPFTKTYPDGYTRWTYGGIIVFCTLDVYFDRSGKITRMFHDH